MIVGGEKIKADSGLKRLAAERTRRPWRTPIVIVADAVADAELGPAPQADGNSAPS
jgi:hypothetical protein